MVKSLSHVQLSATPWTTPRQAPLSMESPGKNTGVGCHALLQGSSRPRVSHISGRFFSGWATQEAPGVSHVPLLLFTWMPPNIQWWDELQIIRTDTPVQKEEKIGGTEELEFHNSPKNPSRHVLEVPWLGLSPTSAWEWFSTAFDFTPWALDSTLWVTLSLLWRDTHVCSCESVCQSASCL